MKKSFFLAIVTITMVLSACSKDDGSDSSEQKIWLNGYEIATSNGDKKVAPVTFLFFPENEGKEYSIATKKSNAANLYEYTKLSEDEIYTLLLEKQQIKLKDGTTVNATYEFTTFDNETLEKTISVGRYFIVALYAYRDTRRVYWNKYACRYYDAISQYNPIVLTATIPADITQYGCIPWINWEDATYEF